MKHLFIMVLFMLAVAFVAATAGTNVSVAGRALTVAEALSADIETPVVLDGTIVRTIQVGEYVFSDGTGEIRLQVTALESQKVLAAHPNQPVHVVGQVAQEMLVTQIVAETISLKQ